ncbi:hypothetical protein Hanom_Chr12g01134791 [Helianthus anomalus]
MIKVYGNYRFCASCHSLPPLKEFRPEIQDELTLAGVSLNRWGYFSLNWSSRSHVYSGSCLELQRTLTSFTLLLLVLLTFQSVTSTGCSVNRRASSICTSSTGMITFSCVGLFFRLDT